jgi:hypothetical protein
MKSINQMSTLNAEQPFPLTCFIGSTRTVYNEIWNISYTLLSGNIIPASSGLSLIHIPFSRTYS